MELPAEFQISDVNFVEKQSGVTSATGGQAAALQRNNGKCLRSEDLSYIA